MTELEALKYLAPESWEFKVTPDEWHDGSKGTMVEVEGTGDFYMLQLFTGAHGADGKDANEFVAVMKWLQQMLLDR